MGRAGRPGHQFVGPECAPGSLRFRPQPPDQRKLDLPTSVWKKTAFWPECKPWSRRTDRWLATDRASALDHRLPRKRRERRHMADELAVGRRSGSDRAGGHRNYV